MADIDSLKRIYRRLAKVKAGDDLATQISWLNDTFVRHAESTNDDSPRVTNISGEGTSTGFAFPDSTPMERSEALDRLITEMEAELAGDPASNRPGFLVPQFCTDALR